MIAKTKKVKVIKSNNLPARLKAVRKAIYSAGCHIGSVHFRKRSNGKLRKMAYRLHVTNPSVAHPPKYKENDSLEKFRNIIKDRENLQITVLDVNKVIKNRKGEIVGRGAWRTIPLETVERIAANKKVYEVKV